MEYEENKIAEIVYHIRIGFNPEYANEMHGLFDVGRICTLLSCYAEKNGNWEISTEPIKRAQGVEAFWSIVDEVEERETNADQN